MKFKTIVTTDWLVLSAKQLPSTSGSWTSHEELSAARECARQVEGEVFERRRVQVSYQADSGDTTTLTLLLPTFKMEGCTMEDTA